MVKPVTSTDTGTGFSEPESDQIENPDTGTEK